MIQGKASLFSFSGVKYDVSVFFFLTTENSLGLSLNYGIAMLTEINQAHCVALLLAILTDVLIFSNFVYS